MRVPTALMPTLIRICCPEKSSHQFLTKRTNYLSRKKSLFCAIVICNCVTNLTDPRSKQVNYRKCKFCNVLMIIWIGILSDVWWFLLFSLTCNSFFPGVMHADARSQLFDLRVMHMSSGSSGRIFRWSLLIELWDTFFRR